MDIIEIWLDDRVIANMQSSFQPGRGDKISIKGETYTVEGLSWSADYMELSHGKRMRLNLNVTKD